MAGQLGGGGGVESREGINGTFGIVRLMSASVGNVLSMAATDCSVLKSDFEKAFECNHNSSEHKALSTLSQTPAPQCSSSTMYSSLGWPCLSNTVRIATESLHSCTNTIAPGVLTNTTVK